MAEVFPGPSFVYAPDPDSTSAWPGTHNASAAEFRADDFAQPGQLIDMSSPIVINANRVMTASEFNTRVICQDGTANYGLTLPLGTSAEDGMAVAVEAARTNTKAVSVTGATGSGATVDGSSEVIMLAGESATFVYRHGSLTWVRRDVVAIPIVSSMLSSGSTALTSNVFNQIPLPIAGPTLMKVDLKSLWNYSGGYWTAPRDGKFRAKGKFWITQTGAPGQLDVGCYSGSGTGGSPGPTKFRRVLISNYTNQDVEFEFIYPMNKGEKLFPSINPLTPLSSCTISSSLSSELTVEEIFQ